MSPLKSLFFFLFLGLSINTLAYPAHENPKQHISVTAVVLKNFPPDYALEKDKRPTGFGIEAFEKVAAISGLKVKYLIKDNWGEVTEALLSGQADLCPLIAATSERRIKLDFTTPIVTEQVSLIVRKTSHHITGLSDLQQRKVGVIKQSAAWELLKARNDIGLIEMEITGQALFELLAGHVDTLAVPEQVFLAMAREAGVGDRIKIVGAPLLEIRRSMAVRKGNSELLRRLESAVQTFVASTEYHKVYARWYGTPPPYWTPQRILWTMSALLLACLLAMVLWRYVTISRLNRQLLTTVAERKKAEELANRTARRLQLLMDAASDGIHVHDLDGNLVESGESFRQMLGYTKEEAAKLNVTDWDVRFKKEELLNLFQVQVEKTVVIETRHRRSDGTEFDVEIHSRPVQMDGRQYIYASSRDITERKQAEEIIQNNLRFQQALMNAIPFPIYYKDAGGIYRGGNKALEKLWGRPLEDIIGKTVYDISPLDLAEIYERADQELLYNPGVQIYETSVASSEGIRRNVIFNKATFTNDEGKVAGLIGVIVDITERKQSEEALRQSEDKFRLAFQTSPDSINIHHLEDGRFVDINQGFTDLTGFTWEDVIGRTSLEINLWHDPADRERMSQNLREQGYCKDLEAVFRRKDGSLLTGLVSARILKFGEVPHIIVITRDITGQKRALEERRKLEEQLQRAEKMEALGTLAGGVAHDLNNALGVIVGFSQLLLLDIDDSNPLRPNLLNILSGSQRAAAIVQDLLTLARRGVTNRQVLNLNKIILDGQHSPEFKNLTSYHPLVKIKSELEPDLLNISGSAVHLAKTIFNLISNASEAMPEGGTLTIQTSNQYLDRPIQGYDEVKEGDYVVLSVSDSGEGIPEADLKRIFEPFFTKKVMGRSGTGLGLAVVWGTVKDHNGYINVQSEEGKGSTFTLYFPVTREEITAEDATVPLSEYLGKGETILVVDDVKGQRDLATTMLRKLNYIVTSIESGEAAVAYLKEHKVDLLVLDMIMDPGMDGLDTYKKTLEINPQQKAIIVSGFSESDRVNSAQALGAGVYLRKPYVIEKLGLAVRQELDRA